MEGIINYFDIFLLDKNNFVFRKNVVVIYENFFLYFGKGIGYIDISFYGLCCNGDENLFYDCFYYLEELNLCYIY